MTPNDEIYIQRETSRETRLFPLPNCIRKNIEDHDKKENKKKNITNRRNKTDIKKRYVRESRIRILKKVMNIPKCQEQKKRQIISKIKL